MLATLAEYERELIIERVNAGIAVTRETGTQFGRPKSDPTAVDEELAIFDTARAPGTTATEAAELVGWSRTTLTAIKPASRQKHLKSRSRPDATSLRKNYRGRTFAAWQRCVPKARCVEHRSVSVSQLFVA